MASEDDFESEDEFEEEEEAEEAEVEAEQDLDLDDLDDIGDFDAAVDVTAEDDEDLHPAVVNGDEHAAVVVGRVAEDTHELDEDLVDDEEIIDEEEDEDEDEEEAEESLDVLLVREQALDDELLRLGEDRSYAPPISPIVAGEFTCRSCFLVKRRAQLADEERLICYDCA